MEDQLSQRRKIENLDEFRNYRKCTGYIILSNSQQTVIHKSSCSYLNEDNFKKSKKEYLWTTQIDNIENEFNHTKPCTACNPFDHNLRFSKY